MQKILTGGGAREARKDKANQLTESAVQIVTGQDTGVL